MKVSTAWVPVFRDGTFTFDIELPVLVDEAGEAYVTLDDALEWERWQEFVAMMIQDSSRLSKKTRRWFGKGGSSAGTTGTDSSRATAQPRVFQLA